MVTSFFALHTVAAEVKSKRVASKVRSAGWVISTIWQMMIPTHEGHGF